MRIHRLEIQAFGPFVQRQEVDFDRLGEQGLFLLEGATGAGKSSVLDAICFALFSSVPGVRQSGHRLRSDHAPMDLAPEVLLEFSVADRFLRIVRSPAWFRPAKRGSSMVKEQAQALLAERRDGEWIALSTRNDEAAHQIEALLGMNREQFTKVVMLAQGEFAAFLRADIKERQVLLQQLFGTERFLALEQKLVESANSAQRGVQSVQQQLTELLQAARLQADDYLPKTPSSAELAALDVAAGEPADIVWDFDGLLAALSRSQADSSARAEFAAEQAGQAAAELTTAEELTSRHAELTAAEFADRSVKAGEADQIERICLVDLHRAAQNFAADLDRLRTAEQSESVARRAGQEALEQLARRKSLMLVLQKADSADADADSNVDLGGSEAVGSAPAAPEMRRLEAVAKELSATAAIVRSLLPEEEQLLRQQAEYNDTVTALAAATARLSQAEDLSDELTAEREAAIDRRDGVSAVAAALEVRQSASHTAKARDTAGANFRRTEQRVQALSIELRTAESVQLTCKARWLELMQIRLERAAGELAAALVHGEPCPVCGGTEHPAPSALQGASLQLAVEEEQAREANERSEGELKQIRDAFNQASTELAAFAALGGDEDAAELARAYQLALVDEEESEQARKHSLRYAEELGALELRLKTAADAALDARAQSQELRAAAEALQRAIAERSGKISNWLGEHALLTERLKELESDEQALARTIEAKRMVGLAAAEVTAAQESMTRKLAGGPFESASDIATALRTAAELTALDTEIAAFRDEEIRARQALGASGVVQAGEERRNGIFGLDAEALSALRLASRQAAEQAQQALLQSQLCARSIEAVQRAAARYAELDSLIAADRERAELLTGLADTGRGLGHNEFKMPLSAYVLAARLEQVADAASERLQVMSDGRYLLAHTDALSGGNKKSGLGLEVVDGWTGQSRDTATLSGGESFMASLALALGLADVVQRESGGTRIDTLFVDEGFGSLDEESLEMVMSSIEGLRDSGRTVGLVSHVVELKIRIPQQLHVMKGRQGSTLSAQTLDRLE